LRIAIISDIHGCLIGLQAALHWLDQTGIEQILCAGDVAGFGPQPNECIELLAERGIPCARGNSDRDLLAPPQITDGLSQRAAQIAEIENWGRARLSGASRAWLADLPPRLAPRPDMLIVHAGLNGLDEIVTERSPLVFPQGVSLVAAGHLHLPFIRATGDGLWVNAGSVGRPCDGDARPALALVEYRDPGWAASIQRIPFDLPAALQAIRSSGMPYAARLLETQHKACWY
jgi:predicted phosphodiesterase